VKGAVVRNAQGSAELLLVLAMAAAITSARYVGDDPLFMGDH
jgi:hypothetical protein